MHLDAYLEKCPAYGWEGAPTFHTEIERLRNKRSRRNAAWIDAEWSFVLPFTNNSPVHYQQVLDMFAVCRGRMHAFRVRNMLFFHADDWTFGTGDGTTDEFQLGRLITVDGESYLQAVFALSIAADAIPLVARVNGTPAGATFQMRTGKVLFDTPPANGATLSWSGYFDFWVYFASDSLPYTITSKSAGVFVVNGQADLIQAEAPDEDFAT